MKKAMRFLVLLLVTVLIFASCASSDTGPSNTQDANEVSGAAKPADDDGNGASGWLEEPSEERDGYGDRYIDLSGEKYLTISENEVILTGDEPTLTFSLKVDTSAYTNVVRYIESGNTPPKDAVKIEEMLNYFNYEAEMEFDGDSPFAIYTEVGQSPFDSSKYMAMVRVKTKDIDRSDLPPSNLTFLIDTSGSMSSYDKLPLLMESFGLLVESLNEDDMVSIVTYAGSSGVLLDSVSGADRNRIMNAINSLSAGGSTAGAEGIQTAYALAEKNYVEGGNNRVILASDGDFNVGISDLDELEAFIGEKRDSGVYLSVLGFGTGNIRDDIMETLAKSGNGNYSYVNTLETANKILVEEMGSTLYTIAEDVKAQVEFDRDLVKGYRLIGYENRMLSNEDFEDDAVDAGEIGIGTDVVVLFEIEPYSNDAAGDHSLFEVRIRYKNPGENTSNLLARPVSYDQIKEDNSKDFIFACSVAVFGHVLRDSNYLGETTLDDALSLAKAGLGKDEAGYKLEYILLLTRYVEMFS